MHKVWESYPPCKMCRKDSPHILYINSLGLSVCLSEPVHFDPLSVSARPILQPPDDKNEVPKRAAPGLKCSSARCGSWWRGRFCNPSDDNLPILCLCSKNLLLQAWNVPAPGADAVQIKQGKGNTVIIYFLNYKNEETNKK